VNGVPVIKLDVRGKTLCVYYALMPEDYANTKYRVERSEIDKCQDTPCLYRITNATRVSNAKELVGIVMLKNGAGKGKTRADKYEFPYQSTTNLIAEGLNKEVVVKESYGDFLEHKNKSEAKAPEREKQIKRRKDTANVHKLCREKVAEEEADAIVSDDIAAELVTERRSGKVYTGKKDIINIDTLSANYEKGEIVTVENMREKGLIDKNADEVKVLARGMLTKPLTVEAQDFSLQAVKMILLTGGTPVKVE
jgi:ribosomal protein L15